MLELIISNRKCCWNQLFLKSAFHWKEFTNFWYRGPIWLIFFLIDSYWSQNSGDIINFVEKSIFTEKIMFFYLTFLKMLHSARKAGIWLIRVENDSLLPVVLDWIEFYFIFFHLMPLFIILKTPILWEIKKWWF